MSGADISIQFRRPKRLDLVAVQLGYLHNYPFASVSYTNAFGIPKALSDAKKLSSNPPLLERGAYERLLGVESLEGIVGVRTNTSSAVFYAVERGAGIGMLLNYALALGAKLVPIDVGLKHRLDIWMTYHPDLRNSYHGGCRLDSPNSRWAAIPMFRREIYTPIRSHASHGRHRDNK